MKYRIWLADTVGKNGMEHRGICMSRVSCEEKYWNVKNTKFFASLEQQFMDLTTSLYLYFRLDVFVCAAEKQNLFNLVY